VRIVRSGNENEPDIGILQESFKAGRGFDAVTLLQCLHSLRVTVKDRDAVNRWAVREVSNNVFPHLSAAKNGHFDCIATAHALPPTSAAAC